MDLNLHRVQGGARLRAGRVARSPLDATIGVDYDNVFGTDQRWLNNGGVRGPLQDDGYFSVPNLGVYSQVEWQAAATVGVTLGLRYDRVTYRFESYTPANLPQKEAAFEQLSPRLSTAWRPRPRYVALRLGRTGLRGPGHQRTLQGVPATLSS